MGFNSAFKGLNSQYPLCSSRPSSSCSRLLPRLPFTFILPSIFPSIVCFRKHYNKAYNKPCPYPATEQYSLHKVKWNKQQRTYKFMRQEAKRRALCSDFLFGRKRGEPPRVRKAWGWKTRPTICCPTAWGSIGGREGADESPCDKCKAQCLDSRRTLGNDTYTKKGGTVQQLAETQEQKCE